MPRLSPEALSRRLKAIRRLMQQHKVDVYLVPSADEHQNEYLPAYKRRREAISGFTGSAGDVAITAKEAHLWVDSRYHLQADQEVDMKQYTVHKLGLPGVPDWMLWVAQTEDKKGPLRVGFDPFLINLRLLERLDQVLRRSKSAAVPVKGNLVDAVW
ncbi:MAG TPA: aminopeptidase P family N-terminal domain-containing protein, partial [bacterium]